MRASERTGSKKKFSRVSAPDDDISAVLICDKKKKTKKFAFSEEKISAMLAERASKFLQIQ